MKQHMTDKEHSPETIEHKIISLIEKICTGVAIDPYTFSRNIQSNSTDLLLTTHITALGDNPHGFWKTPYTGVTLFQSLDSEKLKESGYTYHKGQGITQYQYLTQQTIGEMQIQYNECQETELGYIEHVGHINTLHTIDQETRKHIGDLLSPLT